jgi:hypothetical protein
MHGPLGQNTDDTADTSCSRCGFGEGHQARTGRPSKVGKQLSYWTCLSCKGPPSGELSYTCSILLLNCMSCIVKNHQKPPCQVTLGDVWTVWIICQEFACIWMYLDGCFGSCLGLVLSSSTAVAPRDDLVAWRFGWHCEVTLLECNTQNESESVSSVSSDSSGSRGSYELVTEETNSPSGFSYPAQVHKSPLWLSGHMTRRTADKGSCCFAERNRIWFYSIQHKANQGGQGERPLTQALMESLD